MFQIKQILLRLISGIPDISDDKLNAIITRPTKDHTFEELIGKKIAEEFEVYMGDSGHKGVRVFVANDAVCLRTATKHFLKKRIIHV